METTKQQLERQVQSIGKDLERITEGNYWVFREEDHPLLYFAEGLFNTICERNRKWFLNTATEILTEVIDAALSEDDVIAVKKWSCLHNKVTVAKATAHTLSKEDEQEIIQLWLEDAHVDSILDSLQSAEIIEQAGMRHYFTDPLDIEFRIGTDGQVRGVEIAVALGGPGIWVTTDDGGKVYGAWGTDKSVYYLDTDTKVQIWEWAEEEYELVQAACGRR